jgi:hypothetical protein
MFTRLFVFLGVLAALSAIVSRSELGRPSKKLDRSSLQTPSDHLDLGHHVRAANNEILAQIPKGFVAQLVTQPPGQREKQFAQLFNQPSINHLGWYYVIRDVDTTAAGTQVTVAVTPRITSGVSASLFRFG